MQPHHLELFVRQAIEQRETLQELLR